MVVIYRFGAYELDLGLHELRFEGQACAVEPQVFDLLAYLIEHRDRLVNKDELNEKIWHGRIVTDASLTTAIKSARQAIGDSGRRQDFIKTLPRRGFRFTADVEVQALTTIEAAPPNVALPPDAPKPVLQSGAKIAGHGGRKYWIVAAVFGLLVAGGMALWSLGQIEKPSIAVMPLKNLSDDKDQEYFADGMTDDLITRLSQIDGLFVIARNSTFTYQGKNTEVQLIAKDLGVRYVLEGSVRRSAGKVRINAQLTDGNSGGHVWAEIFDREAKDIFTLQDEVTTKIVTALRLKLTTDEQKKIAKTTTKNLQAYDLYLRARKAHFSQLAPPLRQALKLYKRATDLDPEFADAYAGEAAIAVFFARYNLFQALSPAAALRRAERAIANALEIDPNHGGALAAKSSLLTTLGSHEEAIATARRAVGDNSTNVSARRTLAVALYVSGSVKEGLAEIEIALRQDPRPDKYGSFRTGEAYFLNRNYGLALGFFRRALLLDPKYFQAKNGLIISYAQLGQIAEAKQTVEDSIKAWPPFNVQAMALHRDFWARGVLDHWIGALRKGGTPEWPFGVSFDEVNRLKGAELEALFLGHQIEGVSQQWGAFSVEISADGIWKWKNKGITLTGKGEVDEDKLCYVHDKGLPSRKQCMPYYRNPSGTREKKNEYVNPDAYDVYWFSVVD